MYESQAVAVNSLLAGSLIMAMTEALAEHSVAVSVAVTE